MLLHPEQYTDEQLDQMLHENDIAVPDTEEEWQRFQSVHRDTTRRWLRVAATFIGALMLSGIAFAAIYILTPQTHPQPLPVEGGEKIVYAPLPQQGGDGGGSSGRGAEPLIFNNTPLDEITKELATYYNKEADIRNTEAHNVRLYYKWERKDSLERVVSDLNHFDRVNLAIEDNKLIVK